MAYLAARLKDIERLVGNSCSNVCGNCILDFEHTTSNNLDPIHQKGIAKSFLRAAVTQWQTNPQFRLKTVLMDDAAIRCDASNLRISWLEHGMERLSNGELVKNPESEALCSFCDHQPTNSAEWALDYIFGLTLDLHTDHRWMILTDPGCGGKPGSRKSMSRKAIAEAHQRCLQMDGDFIVNANTMCKVIDDIPELDFMEEHNEYDQWRASKLTTDITN